MRFWRAMGLGLLCLVLSGCMAVEVPDGAGVTYRNSWFNVLALLGIAGAFGIFGVGILWESAKPMLAPKPKRRKGSSRSSAETSNPKQFGGIATGALLAVIGGIILLLGVPSSMLAYVTVGPDRVILRDHLFWFAERPREILYTDLSNVQVEEVEQLARRGTRKKSYLYLSSSAGTDRIEMAAIHKAAQPRLEETWRQFRSGGGAASVQAPVAEAPVTQAPTTLPPGDQPAVASGQAVDASTGAPLPAANAPTTPAAEGGLTQVPHIGRFVPGMQVLATRETRRESAVIVAVYQERQLKVRFDRDGQEGIVPLDSSFISASSIVARRGEGPGREITRDVTLTPGMKLLGHHAGGWFPVEVIHGGAGRVVISWDGERGRHNVPASWLRLPDSEPVEAILPRR